MTNLPSNAVAQNGTVGGAGRRPGGGSGPALFVCWSTAANGMAFGLSFSSHPPNATLRLSLRLWLWPWLWLCVCQMRCLLLGWHNEIPTFDLLTTSSTRTATATATAIAKTARTTRSSVLSSLASSDPFSCRCYCCCCCCGCFYRRRNGDCALCSFVSC